MPSCIVKGCTHYTGMKASNPLLTMHVFPRDLARIKLWLQQIGQNFGDIDTFATKVLDATRTGKYRICSAHFAPGSYTSQGSRIVLKHDAIPTLFPGIYPRPPPDWKDKKPHVSADTIGKSDSRLQTDTPKAVSQRKEAGPQAKADCDKRLQEGARRSQGARPGRTPGPPQEQILDTNGRYTSIFNKGSGQKELKTNELSYNWSLPLPGGTTEENRRALWSLENVMVSLLQHLAEVPLSSRSQKQKTSRLLNQTAEIVSLLTGEEWTVVKKNSHISKFYNMIREVPIKCGDVAVFFSMDEWDYIEDHEDHYKHVMVEEPRSLQSNGGTDGVKMDSHLETQCEQRPSPQGDVDDGGPLDDSRSAMTPPTLTDRSKETKRKDEDVESHDVNRTTDDVIEERASDTSHSENMDSSSGDSEDLDDPQSPESPPLRTDKRKEKVQDDDLTLEVTCFSDDDIADETPDTPQSPRTDSASAVPSRGETSEEAPESSGSDLWIAQDGTTSSRWIPQEDPRPPGRNFTRYGGKPPRIQCPVSLSGTTTAVIICDPELYGEDLALEPRCNLCHLTFPDKYELDLHQTTHSKKQRL